MLSFVLQLGKLNATKKILLKKRLKSSHEEKLASQILEEFMPLRRMVKESCQSTFCPHCLAPHLEKVKMKVKQKKPIHLILPAFPGKSPNPAKVFGRNPDMAESLALSFLNELCLKVKEIYPPGAEISLCSDGRVFSDVVGMKEEDVTSYRDELDEIIREKKLSQIKTFSLEDLSEEKTFEEARRDLMGHYAESLSILKEKVKRGSCAPRSEKEEEAHRMFCGMTRFLFEDSLHPKQTKSRTSLQKEAKRKAYELILRSNAWSEFLKEHYPEAVRLSIHPQSCGSKKLGIRLLSEEAWLTPWHSVAVKRKEGFLLMKKKEVEKLSARLVFDKKGRPSHYSLEEPFS